MQGPSRLAVGGGGCHCYGESKLPCQSSQRACACLFDINEPRDCPGLPQELCDVGKLSGSPVADLAMLVEVRGGRFAYVVENKCCVNSRNTITSSDFWERVKNQLGNVESLLRQCGVVKKVVALGKEAYEDLQRELQKPMQQRGSSTIWLHLKEIRDKILPVPCNNFSWEISDRGVRIICKWPRCECRR